MHRAKEAEAPAGEWRLRSCPHCGDRHLGREDTCLTCRRALKQGKVEIVRGSADEDGAAKRIITREELEGMAIRIEEIERSPEIEEPAPRKWPAPKEELAALVAQGLSNTEIGERYGVEAKTVGSRLYWLRIKRDGEAAKRRVITTLEQRPDDSEPGEQVDGQGLEPCAVTGPEDTALEGGGVEVAAWEEPCNEVEPVDELWGRLVIHKCCPDTVLFLRGVGSSPVGEAVLDFLGDVDPGREYEIIVRPVAGGRG